MTAQEVIAEAMAADCLRHTATAGERGCGGPSASASASASADARNGRSANLTHKHTHTRHKERRRAIHDLSSMPSAISNWSTSTAGVAAANAVDFGFKLARQGSSAAQQQAMKLSSATQAAASLLDAGEFMLDGLPCRLKRELLRALDDLPNITNPQAQTVVSMLKAVINAVPTTDESCDRAKKTAKSPTEPPVEQQTPREHQVGKAVMERVASHVAM